MERITAKPIEYKVAPYGHIADIPAGVSVKPANNLSGGGFWVDQWAGMSEKARGWESYGFLVDESETVPARWHSSSCGRVEILIPVDAIGDIFQPGSADAAVSGWVDSVYWGSTKPDDIRNALRECGAWDDEELADDEQNRHRYLWVAACDLGEQSED
jgi:hypothetical protein